MKLTVTAYDRDVDTFLFYLLLLTDLGRLGLGSWAQIRCNFLGSLRRAQRRVTPHDRKHQATTNIERRSMLEGR